jgi:hypothetical protein
LHTIGCIKKVKARPEYNIGTDTKYFRCLKFIRLPTEKDREHFLSQGPKEDGSLQKESAKPIEVENDESLRDDDHMDVVQNPERGGPDDENGKLTRIPPQWTPCQPLSNFCFDLIQYHGVEGASSSVASKTQLIVHTWLTIGRISDQGVSEITGPDRLM